VVIFGGRVVAELAAEDADEATLMRAAHGLGRDGGDVAAYVGSDKSGRTSA
jgi:hypothetical protein